MPFQDALNLFKEDMEKVNERLETRSRKGERDGQAIIVAHEIDKQLRGLDETLKQLKNLAEESDKKRAKIAKKSAKDPKEDDKQKMSILEKEYRLRITMCETCEKGLNVLKEKNQTLPTKKGMTDKEKLMGGRIANTKGGPATAYTAVDDAIAQGAESGGAANLDTDAETKDQMKKKRQKDAQIDSALDQIGALVGRLGQNANLISEEVDKQNVALDNLEVKMDKTTDKLSGINGRLGKLVKGSSKVNIVVNILVGILILAVVGYVLYEMDVLPS
eukprot:GILI01015438.1.p1 GENE.GILI01015438.1~~GILI01015438.1.p1  ORF type:complete len:288 (-),score=51.26 GILI01015438.1:124-948(-)